MEQLGVAQHRRELLAGISGSVIEIGAGTGANFPHYPDGVSEIVGVATAEAWRRRGLAGAVTAAAARGAFAAGAELCLLTPGDEGALRVYARAGFRRVARMLHWSDA